MRVSDTSSSLAALIEAHGEAWSRWETISRKIGDARHAHDELERAHEAANGAEREALAALMAFPVQTLDEARLKAAYFLSLPCARDLADEPVLLFLRSLLDGARGDARTPA